MGVKIILIYKLYKMAKYFEYIDLEAIFDGYEYNGDKDDDDFQDELHEILDEYICGEHEHFIRDLVHTYTCRFALACVAMSENPVRRKFSRHIDIRNYYVHGLVLAGFLKLVSLRTHKMVADTLTKSLPSPAFIRHRQIMTGHASFAARLLRCVDG